MGKLSVIRFLKYQWRDLPLASTDLTGKTVLITGASAGLGFEASKHIARMKPGKLILGCRDMTKAEEAAKVIRNETGIGEELVVWHLDLCEFSSVKAFADKFEAEGGGRLDLFIANAAMGTRAFQKTDDGWEKAVQVNHLSTALLALLLLPFQLKTPEQAPTPRLVFVSSDAHHLAVPFKGFAEAKISEKLSDPEYTRNSSPMSDRYNVTKLLNLLFFREITARLQTPPPLTVVAVHPGLCHSELSREMKGLLRMSFNTVKALIARSSEMGSRTIVWGAIGGENKTVHGRYLDSCTVQEENDWILEKDGQTMQGNLWTETINVLKKIDPRVETIVQEHLTPK